MPKVSVIVPVYNAERYLAECMESLVQQTMMDMEILCVDDGSTDHSADILNEYCRKDERIRLIHNSCNMGEVAARNKALKVATGEYILFVDADDYIEKETTEELYIHSIQSNADMCYLGLQKHLEEGIKEDTVPESIVGVYDGVYDGKKLLYELTRNKEFFLYCCSVFYRRSFLERNQLTFRKLVIGEGGDFILRGLCKAERVIVCRKKYYHYRVHGASITHSEHAKKELLIGQIVQYVDVLQQFAQNESATEIGYFLANLYKKIAGGLQCLTLGEKKEILKRMNSPFSENVFRLLCTNLYTYELNMDANMLERIRNKKHVIIYGAGYASKDMLQFFHENEIEMLGFAVSRRKNGEKTLFGHHIYEISELRSYADDSIVVVAANKKYKNEIRATLDEFGFKDCIYLDIEI